MDFTGKLAVVTGGGSGMGRELVLQLAAAGCSVAACDLNPESVAETAQLALAGAPAGVRITSHVCDVSDAAAVNGFRDEVLAQHETDHVNLLFNNAGVFGAGSFVVDDPAVWERIFGICWGGTYNCSRAFIPLLVASDEGYVVNTSSINAVWARHGAGLPSTAYGSAKFAVRGLSEALIEDFRTNAPHVKVAIVMPGSISTNLGANTTRVLGRSPMAAAASDTRGFLLSLGAPVEHASEDQVEAVSTAMWDVMRECGFQTPADEAAATILDGIRADRWRIIVGRDAERLDRLVRADPEKAYAADGTYLIAQWILVLATMIALFDPAAGDLSTDVELRFGDDRVGIRADAGRLSVSREPAARVDATLDTDVPTLRALLDGTRSLDDAVSAGALKLSGDRSAVERLVAAIPLPAA